MPPRKSDASKVATADEATPAKDQPAVRDGINIEDLNLPKSIVTRLAKGVLPPNTQVQGNAMLATTKSATVFVNYLASHANEHASASNRKTIGPQDVFNALEDLEFPDFRNRLEAELAKFNEVQTDKRNAYRSKVANKAAGAGDQGEDDTQGGDRDGRPAAKKARLEGGEGEGSGGDGEIDPDETQDADQTEEDDDAQEEEDDDDDEVDEQMEADEQLEDIEQRDVDDEALDNGEDSD